MRAIAPGKLILSGEHSVVYGQPALAMAVDRSVQVVIDDDPDDQITFDLPDYAYSERFTVRALRETQRRIVRDYQLFMDGKLSIGKVLQKPVELVQFAFITVLDGLHLKLEKHGLAVRLLSDIPRGCGLGSSAASALSMIRAVGHYFRVDFRPDWHYRYSMEAERVQHGNPSGLDAYVSLHGGCVRFQQGEAEKLPMPAMPFYLINTGEPLTSTGECVSHVRETHGNSDIWAEFGQVTDAMGHAMARQDLEATQAAVRDNHRLLERIGVVPERVGAFVRAVEQRESAAKISGAGAVAGESAGIVTVFGEEPPTDLCDEFGYELLTARGDPLGVRLVGV